MLPCLSLPFAKSKSAQIWKLLHLDYLIDNINNELPIVSITTQDFNARCSKWSNKDITNSVGHETDSLILSAGYQQLITKTTHMTNNSLPCINLIFCNNQNLISDYGVDLSIFEKCHHNIILGKINIHIPLPLSYVCEVWDYSKATLKTYKSLF